MEGAFDENGEPVMEKIIYGSQYYYLELDTARRLCELNIQSEEKEETVRKRLANIEKEMSWSWMNCNGKRWWRR